MSVSLNTNLVNTATQPSLRPSSTAVAEPDHVAAGGSPASSEASAVVDATTSLSPEARAADALDRAASVADSANAAGGAVTATLVKLRQTVDTATNPTLSVSDRATLRGDYQSFVKKLHAAISSASFDGANLLDGSTTSTGLSFQGSGASSGVTLRGTDLRPGGKVITIASNADLSTPHNASSVLTQVDTSISATRQALGQIATQGKSAASAAPSTSGVDTAELIAVQVRQALASQPLAIANQNSQAILKLFKS